MRRSSLKIMALMALGSFVVTVLQAWKVESEKPKPVYELDCEARRLVGSPLSGQYVLRLALLRLADAANTEAVIDAVELNLQQGAEFDVDLGFQTRPISQPVSKPVSRFGFSLRSRKVEWESKIPRSRPLPPEFNSMKLHLVLSGKYHGQHDGMHLLSLVSFDGSRYNGGPGWSSSGSAHLPVSSTAMNTDVPIARMYLRNNLAVFAVITTEGSSVVADPGRREDWRRAFLETRKLPPLLNREAVHSAVTEIEPVKDTGVCDAGEFMAYGPMIDLLTAAYVLRDASAVRFVRDRLEAEPGLLARIRASVLAASEDQRHQGFLAKTGRPWLQFLSGWMRGWLDVSAFDRQSTWAIGLRLLDMSESDSLAKQVVDVMIPRSRGSSNAGYILNTSVLGRTEGVKSEYQRLRSEVLWKLPAPWSWVLQSLWLLIAFTILLPCLALIVFFVSPRARRPKIQISRTAIFLLAVGSFMTIGPWPIKILILPGWWFLAIRWLREPVEHSMLERGMIWMGLALTSLGALQSVNWFYKGTTLTAATQGGIFFCWILVALCVHRDGRWRKPGFLLAFLWSLLSLQVLTMPLGRQILAWNRLYPAVDPANFAALTPENQILPYVGLVFFLLALLSLLIFWLLGPTQPAPRTRRGRRRLHNPGPDGPSPLGPYR